jgi:hypothetical protein
MDEGERGERSPWVVDFAAGNRGLGGSARMYTVSSSGRAGLGVLVDPFLCRTDGILDSREGIGDVKHYLLAKLNDGTVIAVRIDLRLYSQLSQHDGVLSLD